MNPDLQKQLAELLARGMDVASDASKWAAQQIPPLVQEKIVFGRAYETAAEIGSLVMAAILIRLAMKLWRLAHADDYDNPLHVVGGLITSIVCVLPVICAISEAESFFMVWFAPRLYIVEWLRTFVK